MTRRSNICGDEEVEGGWVSFEASFFVQRGSVSIVCSFFNYFLDREFVMELIVETFMNSDPSFVWLRLRVMEMTGFLYGVWLLLFEILSL